MKRFNICLIKPDNYIHSYAFLELGELIYYSLFELGFNAAITFNTLDPDAKNIIIGCHLLDPILISKIPKSTIIVNTEQVYLDDSSWNENIFFWAQNFELWDYSTKNIDRFKELGVSEPKHLGIGFQKELVRIHKNTHKDVDVLFYGSLNKRRSQILDSLVSRGVKVKKLFGIYGKERDEWVGRSKIVLNHHFYKSQIFEIVRVFYLLTNSVAVVGEVNKTTSIDKVYKEGILPAKYDDLVEKCLEIINNKSLREQLQLAALRSISKTPQREFMSKVID